MHDLGKSLDKMPILDSVTPYNVQLCGIYKRSFAYFTIKERLPVIITKIIDHLSRDRDAIAAEYGKEAIEDCKSVIGRMSRLKNEIQTNKKFANLAVSGGDADKWNALVDQQQDCYYFTNIWLFTECYVYRRIREAFQLTNSLTEFDPFRLQKDTSFNQSVEAMCLVANYLTEMLSNSETSKDDFVNLLKMTLWGNKCDLSLSAGEDVSQATNPLKMVDLFEKNIIVDHSATIYDELLKMTQGKNDVVIDYVCDNAAYELFTDLCFADFLVTKKIANKIRFRVKAMPWFVSDVMIRDFVWTLESLSSLNFTKELNNFVLNSVNLNAIGSKWKTYLEQGTWTVQADEFWTMPHEFYKMKFVDKDLYDGLGEATMIIFKGDLNYRKLMGEMNWSPTTPFDEALRGFFPGPLVAIRTVKADLISGLPAGKKEELDALDEKWMEKGDYGLIQYSSKRESS